MYNIAIVEDEEYYSSQLRQYITRFAEENKHSVTISCYRSIEDFMVPRQESYDLVIFDVGLPGMNGIDGAKRFREYDSEAVIFFVTGHAQYALNGYEVEAMAYMLKPVSYTALASKLAKAFKKISSKKQESVVIRERDEIHKISVEDIFYLEVRDHVITFHTADGQLNITGTLNIYEEQLKGQFFSRCNNCYLVNMRAVSSIEKSIVYLCNGEQLNMSRRRKTEFFNDFINFVGVK